LPSAIVHHFGWSAGSVTAIQLILTCIAILISIRLFRIIRPLIVGDILGVYPLAFLVVGSLLIVGAFFTHSNIAYRAVFLLFALPGLFRLKEMKSGTQRIYSLTLIAIILCLWEAVFRVPLHLVDRAFAGSGIASVFTNAASCAFFLTREAAWWWIAIVLLAVLISSFSQAPALRLLFSHIALKQSRPRVGHTANKY
jgi:hypothetical protein